MCKPLPGPRCAGHTRKAVNQKLRALAKEKVQLASLVGSSIPDENLSEYIQQVQLLYIEVDQHERELLEAKRKYWTTPEGQAELTTKIEEAETPEQAEALKEELATAKEVRRVQMQMHHLVQAGNRNLKSLTPEQSEALLERKREILQTEEQRHDAEQVLIGALRTAEATPADTTNELRWTLVNDVRSSHDRLAVLLRDTYVRHGVDREMANHYAKDAIESMKGDVAGHLLSDGTRPIHTLKDTFILKEKSPMAQAAADEIHESKEVAEAHEKVIASHARYNALIPKTLESRKRQREVQAAVDETEKTVNTLAAKSRYLRQRDAHYQGLAARWGSAPPRSYEVTKNQFVKSSYHNPDGSTNAYVLSPEFSKSTGPMYLQVTGVEEDGGGRKVLTLENGERLTGEDANQVKFILVKPAEHAKALFGDD